MKKYILFSFFLCFIYNECIAAKTDSTFIFAEAILNNKVNPSDDKYTFNCLKKLNANNIEERLYYFEVLKVILIKSDGALSEALGSYLLKYIDANPNEAIKNYVSLNVKQKASFIHHISYELSFDEKATNSKEFIDLYFRKIAKKINLKELDKFELFKRELFMTFHEVYNNME